MGMGNYKLCCKDPIVSKAEIGVPERYDETDQLKKEDIIIKKSNTNKSKTDAFYFQESHFNERKELRENSKIEEALESVLPSNLIPSIDSSTSKTTLIENGQDKCSSKSIGVRIGFSPDILSRRSKMDSLDCNIFLLGMSEVGKSSLIIRYTECRFETYHIPTIKLEVVPFEAIHEGKKTYLNIVDTTGLPEYQTEIYDLYNQCDVIIYVFRAGNTKSFLYAKSLIQENWKHGINSILVGNMSDLNSTKKNTENPKWEFSNSNQKDSEKEVNNTPWFKFAIENNLEFYETSAKYNSNIQKVFRRACEMHFQTQNSRQRRLSAKSVSTFKGEK
jgi:small GTP-binding protein